MAKAKTSTKAAEEILKDDDVAGTTEETTAPAEATEGENVVGPDVAETPTPKDDGKVEVFVPTNLLTEEEYVEVGYNGKIYQVMCGMSVRVPKGVAEILANSITQKKKVEALKKKRSAKSVELRRE